MPVSLHRMADCDESTSPAAQGCYFGPVDELDEMSMERMKSVSMKLAASASRRRSAQPQTYSETAATARSKHQMVTD
jgi:hypothetical protein